MARQVPAEGIRASPPQWQRTQFQTPQSQQFWSASTQPPIDEPPSVRAANVWSSYLGHANKIDRDRVETWKGEMDGILIFSGLFSAVVTTFIIETYKLLQPDNTQVSTDLLVRVVAALENIPAGAVAAAASIDRPPPITISLWINCLWFTSLLFSLACALIATLVQQWSREYIQGTERRASLNQRARVRAYLAEGVDRFGADLLISFIPLLLHFAVLLFIVGLVLFAFTIHNVLAYINLIMAILSGLIYGTLTLMPVFVLACPFKTPLSTVLQRALATIQPEFRARTVLLGHDRRPPREGGLSSSAEPEVANGLETDKNIIRWTIDTWRDDHDLTDANLAALFGALPDVVQPALRRNKLQEAMEVVRTLLFDEHKIGYELPRLLRTYARASRPFNTLLETHCDSCLRTLLLLTKLAGNEQLLLSFRTEITKITESCLYPAVEWLKYLYLMGVTLRTTSRETWHCVILLLGLLLRHYWDCLKGIQDNVGHSPQELSAATHESVHKLFHIRNMLNILLDSYLRGVMCKPCPFVPPHSPLRVLFHQLNTGHTTDTVSANVDALKRFVQEQLVLVKDAYRVFHLITGMMAVREGFLFPDETAACKDLFNVTSVHLQQWQGRSKYDEQTAVKELLEDMFYDPPDVSNHPPVALAESVADEPQGASEVTTSLGLSTPSASSAAGVVVEPDGAPDVQNDTAPLASFSSTIESSVRVTDNVVEDAFRASAHRVPPIRSPANPLAHPDLSNGEDEQPMQLEGSSSINQYGIFFTRVYPRGALEIVRRNMELFPPAQTEGTDADSGVRTSQQDGRGEGDRSLEARGEEEEASENSEPTVAVDARVHWARRLAQSLGWSRINGNTDDANDGGNTEDGQYSDAKV